MNPNLKGSNSDSESEEESFKDYKNPDFRKLYATMSVKELKDDSSDVDETTNLITDPESILPSGWEKHKDENGAYYWHISR